MKQVAKSLSIPFVIMCTLVLLTTLAVTPASAIEEDIDHEAVKELHDALQDAKEHGDPIVGDISEKALIKEIESKSQGLKAQGGDGCSTPKATKKLTQKYDKVFLAACNKQDICYGPQSTTDQKNCDDQFGKDMNKICSNNPQGDESQCLRMATIYKAGVRLGGKKSYKGKGKNN